MTSFSRYPYRAIFLFWLSVHLFIATMHTRNGAASMAPHQLEEVLSQVLNYPLLQGAKSSALSRRGSKLWSTLIYQDNYLSFWG